MKMRTKILNTCAYTHTQMGTKTISIMDDVYELLARNKKAEESFSDELRRILPKKRSIMEFAGAWKDVTEGEAERMKARISRLRKDFDRDFEERRKKFDKVLHKIQQPKMKELWDNQDDEAWEKVGS